MKTTTTKAALLAALSNVAPYVDRSPILPILSNVVIDTAGDAFGLTIRGTNLTAYAETSCEATSAESDRIAVNAATLMSALKSLPDGPVSLSASAGNAVITIESGDSRFKLAGMPADDMPDRDHKEPIVSFNVKGADFVRAVRRALAAVDSGYPSQALRGVHLFVDEGGLIATGSDGKRLVRYPSPLSDFTEYRDGKGEVEAIIPADVASKAVSTFADAESIKVEIADGKVVMRSDDVTVDTNVISAQYPNVDAVVPGTFAVTFDVAVADIRAAIGQAAVVCVADSLIARLDVTPSGMRVASAGVGCGEFSTEIPVSNYNGAPIAMAFNIGFLSSALKLVDGDSVRFNANTPKTPVVFGDAENPDVTLLVMPIVAPVAREDPVAA